MDRKTLISDLEAGHRLTEDEALALLSERGRGAFEIMAAADRVREQKAGDIVTYVRNQNIHVTNICKNLCGFCGFGRNAADPSAYCDDKETVESKARLALFRKVTEICLLSGIHPDFSAESYVELLSWVKDAAPGIHLHAFSPEEVAHAAERSGTSTRDVLERLVAAGLGSLQGTAAEILVDDVREVICPNKIDTQTWVRIIREAHGLGIPTTATIMYGSCEQVKDRVRHLGIVREIQDETNGFTEFVPLSYLHAGTSLYHSSIAGPGATGREDLLLIAVSRLFLDNFRNIQVSWGKLGLKLAQIGLVSGANDLAGTMFSDAISTDAGARDADYLDPTVMERVAADLGRPLRQRTTDYRIVS